MKTCVSKIIVVNVGCFLIVRLMCTKIKGIFEMNKMFNKNIYLRIYSCAYCIDNQRNIFDNKYI